MPEILAPVGSLEMARAAVYGGAHAVYVGFPGFNARGRTPDFDLDTFSELLELCHLHGVKVYVAVNVLVFESEWSTLLAPARDLIALGIDAFIVQDLGVARLLRQLSPSIRLHASTQMTVTAPEAIELTQDLGLARYVLARELSLKEIAEVRRGSLQELEVFVHGALCVSYSGQCLTSESFGGRSANRGQCAQSCRLDYDLLVDGEKRDLGEKRYLVSPQDLCGLDEIPALSALGVDSFKIEGRLKTPAYVAAASRAYNAAIGALSAPPDSQDGDRQSESAELRKALTITYSRGFFSGWLHGVDHQALVPATYSHHRGLALGQVLAVKSDAILVARGPLPGDGMLFLPTAGTPSDHGVAGRVFTAKSATSGELAFALKQLPATARLEAIPAKAQWLRFDYALPVQRIEPGWVAYWNDSPHLERLLTSPLRDRQIQPKVPVRARVAGKAGQPLVLTLTLLDERNEKDESDESSLSVTVASAFPLTAAKNAPFSEADAREELQSMQGEGFALAHLDYEVEGAVFVHGKAWRKQRQIAVESLRAAQVKAPNPTLTEPSAVIAWAETQIRNLHDREFKNAGLASEALPKPSSSPRLHVLLRDLAQCEALCGQPGETPRATRVEAEPGLFPSQRIVQSVFLDFEYGRDYKTALEMLRQAGYQAGIATTRIMKPLEKHNLTVIEKLRPDAVLVRNLAALQALRMTGLPLIGDFSLNAANSLSVDYLLGKGLQRLTPSYDLNQNQLLDLLLAAGGQHFEITLHQYLPAFHMEHCVFAGFLSQGHSFKDCGKPCERHRVALRDHTGAVHPLKADQECRNTMFHGTPQSSARLLPQWLAAGVRDFRVEFLWENGTEVLRHLRLYADLLSGSRPASEVFAELRVGERYGVSEGQLRQTAVWKDRKKGSQVLG